MQNQRMSQARGSMISVPGDVSVTLFLDNRAETRIDVHGLSTHSTSAVADKECRHGTNVRLRGEVGKRRSFVVKLLHIAKVGDSAGRPGSNGAGRTGRKMGDNKISIPCVEASIHAFCSAHIAFTRILFGPSSAAMARVTLSSAALTGPLIGVWSEGPAIGQCCKHTHQAVVRNNLLCAQL